MADRNVRLSAMKLPHNSSFFLDTPMMKTHGD
jgi:hypothetical protein